MFSGNTNVTGSGRQAPHEILEPTGNKFAKRMAAGASALIFAFALVACGSSNSMADAVKLTQAQFNTFLAASEAFIGLSNDVANVKTSVTTVTTNEASDAATIQRMAIFGHAPGAKTVIDTMGRRTYAFNGSHAAFTSAINFGPCPDMGTHVQDGGGAKDPMQGSTVELRQCVINGNQYFYEVADDGVGAVLPPPTLFYSTADCSGTPIVFVGDSFNFSHLESGLVYTNSVDGTQWKVDPGQTPQTVTAVSSIIGKSGCGPNAQQGQAFVSTPNDVNVTGVPSAVGPISY